MSDKKISELTAATSVSLADVVPVVQGSTTKKLTVQVLTDNLPNVKNKGIYVDASTPDTVQSGAISLTTSTTYITNNSGGLQSLTLADGAQGQEKTLLMTERLTHNSDVTPTNASFTKLTFTAPGQTATLKFMNGDWNIISVYGTTVV